MNEKNTYPFLTKVCYFILLLLLILVGIGGVTMGLGLWKLRYEGTLLALADLLQLGSYLEKFRTHYFTPTVYTLLIWTSLVLGVLSGIFAYGVYRWSTICLGIFKVLIRTLAFLLRRFFEPLQQLPKSYQWLLFASLGYILYSRILLSSSTAFHIDEMHSWLHFINKGFLVSLTYYPSPNNHVLFSLFAGIPDLFFNNPFVVMRVAAITIGIFVSFLVFRFALGRMDFPWALLCMLLFSFVPVIQHYSVLGRGYILETGLFIVAFWSFLKWTAEPFTKRYAVLYVFSSGMACFTLVTYVYALVGFGFAGLYFFKTTPLRIRWLGANLLTGIFIAILYTPLLLFSGINSIIGNGWIIRPGWEEYWNKIPEMAMRHAEYFTSIEHQPLAVWLVIWALILLGQWKARDRRIFFTSVILFASSIFITFLQRIVPYERMWTHLIFCQQFLLTASIVQLLSPWQNRKWIASSFIGGFFCAQAVLAMLPKNKADDIYDRAELVSMKMLEQNPGSIYCQEYVYYNYLQVGARTTGKTTRIDNEALEYMPDFVVHDLTLPWPVHLKQQDYGLWTPCNRFVCIYQRRGYRE